MNRYVLCANDADILLVDKSLKNINKIVNYNIRLLGD